MCTHSLVNASCLGLPSDITPPGWTTLPFDSEHSVPLCLQLPPPPANNHHNVDIEGSDPSVVPRRRLSDPLDASDAWYWGGLVDSPARPVFHRHRGRLGAAAGRSRATTGRAVGVNTSVQLHGRRRRAHFVTRTTCDGEACSLSSGN